MAFINNWGIAETFFAEDGKVKFGATDARMKEALEWLHRCYEEKLIDMEYLTLDKTAWYSEWTNNQVFMSYDWAAYIDNVSNLFKNENSDIRIVGALPPEGPTGISETRDQLQPIADGEWNAAIYVGATDEQKKAAMKLFDYLYSEEGSMLAQAGQEGVEYEKNADGTWVWMDSLETVANSVLSEATIADGGNAPGYYPAELQLTFDNSDTHRIVSNMQTLTEYAVYPYPLVYLDSAARERVNAIQLELGAYAENAMVRFVTGDIPLTDESWNDYTAQLDNLGLQEMLEIWQNALK